MPLDRVVLIPLSPHDAACADGHGLPAAEFYARRGVVQNERRARDFVSAGGGIKAEVCRGDIAAPEDADFSSSDEMPADGARRVCESNRPRIDLRRVFQRRVRDAQRCTTRGRRSAKRNDSRVDGNGIIPSVSNKETIRVKADSQKR